MSRHRAATIGFLKSSAAPETPKKPAPALKASLPSSIVAGLLRAGELLAAIVLAVGVSTLVLKAVDRLAVPEPSNVDTARLTFVTTGCVLVVAAAAWLHHRSRSGASSVMTWMVSTVSVAVLGSAQLATLLRGTPHYLFGLSGDQTFRVPYLARLAESAVLRDVFYADAIPYYPPLWFWLGGRFANLSGSAGWEEYKPFALATMSVVAAVVFVAWRWLVGASSAGLIAAATAAVGTYFNAYEPYSWVVIAMVPLLCVWTVRTVSALIDALSRGVSPGQVLRRSLGPALVIGGLLGLAAMTYTLVAGVACLAVAICTVTVVATRARTRVAGATSLVWLVSTGLVTVIVALVYWGRHLLALLLDVPHSPSVATDFLSPEGATLTSPFMTPSAFGLTCLIGLVMLTGAAGLYWRTSRTSETAAADPVVNMPESPRVISTGLLVTGVTGYLWSVASLGSSFMNSTLLAFRIIPLITLVLVTGGVYWLCQIAFRRNPRPAPTKRPPDHQELWSAALTPSAGVLVVLLTAGMAQSISPDNREYAQVALHTPAQPTELLSAFDELVAPEDSTQTIVLSAQPQLFAYRDVFAFQSPVESYATPFARYPERNEEIQRYAEAQTPQDLVAALGTSEFAAPDVFILNRDEDGLSYPVSVNQMPVQPDNAIHPVRFNPAAFADPTLFEHRSVGPLEIYARR